jgi:uncharacterized membrane protein (UPF0127 family)
MSRRAIRALLVACLVLGAGCAGMDPTAPSATPTPSTSAGGDAPSTTTTAPVATPGSDYETTTVVLLDGDGTELATVDAWVADTWPKQYTGLSDTEALDDGQGMLFVFDDEGDRSFVMRDMAFPLDMVFVAADGTITTIHHAPVESDDDLTQYTGRAKFVLEVPMGYTNETGVEVGDRIRIEDR